MVVGVDEEGVVGQPAQGKGDDDKGRHLDHLGGEGGGGDGDGRRYGDGGRTLVTIILAR